MREADRGALAERVLSFSAAQETEVLIFDESQALTRFSHQSIHQNVASEAVTVRVRVINDGRTGVATTTLLDEQALHDVVDRATSIATFAPRDEQWPGLPAASPAQSAIAGSYVEATASASADERATIAGRIFEVSEADALWSAGFVSTSRQGVTLANSRGVRASFDGTEALANIKQTGSDSTGYGEAAATDITAADGVEAARIAARKACASAKPRAVEPGTWTVLLEPVAFAELLSYLTDSFSAQSVDEGASFVEWEGIGRTVVDTSLTMRDDWTHPLAPGLPFDYEGVPRTKVALFERGTIGDVVTDSRWAAKLGRVNTGHALPSPNSEGPQPLNVTVDPGHVSFDDLLASIERGLLISRFWYIRPVDRKQTIVTGMTRDGTFLIENGKVTSGVHNLRFNQSILAALAKVTLSDSPRRTTGLGYTMVVPAARIEAFTFSSSTSF